MQMRRYNICLLLVCFLIGSNYLGADDRINNQSSNEQYLTPRGTSGAVGCPVYREKRSCSCGCPCTFDCKCGCQEGAPCHCDSNVEPLQEEPQAYYREDDSEQCGNNCCCYAGPSFRPVCYERLANPCCSCGVWLPHDPVLFRPIIADPRQICYSAGWRLNDQVFVKNVIDVSYGDTIPFYRWCNIGPWCGQLQIELEGALWAVFDPLHDSSPLMNADYYGGLTLTYAVNDWSWRLRGYHISSHIGDEFLLNHPHFHRKNPSAEYLDLYVSNDLTDEIRIYAGLGWVVAMDESFHCGRYYSEAGMEIRMPQLGFVNYCHQVYGMPIFAMDFRAQTKQNRHLNQTYVLGYEWGQLGGVQHKLRIYLEYHDGYSYEGQFCKFPTTYCSLRASWGY